MIRLSSLAAIAFLPLSCIAQSTSGPAAPTPQASSVPSLQVHSDLVLVDVVVTKNGVPVQGLTKDKFRVFENGKNQDLKTFEEHAQPEQAESQNNAAAQAPKLGANNYSDFPQYSPSSSMNVLLLDGLNTPTTDQAYVRKQMLDYLGKVPPGTRLAVFTLASRLRMVQSFTTDSSLISKAISGKDDLADSVLLDRGDQSQLSQMQITMSQWSALEMAEIELRQFQADLKSYEFDERQRMTLEALQQIAHYLGTIPGRKNLIWFSGSFPLFVPSDRADHNPVQQDPWEAMRNYSTEIKQTDVLLSDARVAVYPVDARGLVSRETSNTADNDPADLGQFTSRTTYGDIQNNTGRKGKNGTLMPDPEISLNALDDAHRNLAAEIGYEHQTMQQIAADTGGKAFVDTNGLEAAVSQALADGANYYTIGYMPPFKDDGQFRRIKVDVKGGYQLEYREEYYAKSEENATTGPQTMASEMKTAMEFGAPPPSDILFKVRVITADDPVAKSFTPAPGPAGANAKEIKGPVTRYLIDYMVDAHHFTYRRTPDGAAHTRLEFTVLAYDADGKVLNYTDRGFEANLPPPLYAQVMHTGFPMHQEIDLPAGQVFLRIVVHDLDSSSVGATEVPVIVAKR